MQGGVVGSAQGMEPGSHGLPEGRALSPSHTAQVPGLASVSRALSLDFSIRETGTMMTMTVCLPCTVTAWERLPTVMSGRGLATVGTI